VGLRFRLAWSLRALALVTGVVTWWRFRFDMNPDGVHYLEMGDGVVRGDWGRLVNSYWSPLFPLAVGLVRRVLAPALEVEAPAAHAVQLLAWVLGWIAVERLVHACAGVAGVADERGREDLLVLGGGCYLWYGTAHLAGIVTPDLLLSGLLLLATREAVLLVWGSRGSAFGFGVLLALAYLAKAIVFPVAGAVLAVALLAGAWRGPGFRLLLTAGAGFAVVSLPWIAVLSLHYGRFTTGDAGRLNYGWYVNEWHGPGAEGPRVITRAAGTSTPSRFGAVRRPIPVVLEEPRILFAGGGPVSAFPWDSDPAYWEDGLKTRLEPTAQLRRIRAELPVLHDALLSGFGAAVVLLVLVAFPGAARRAGQTRLIWFALSPLAAIGLYVLVHLEARLAVPFWLPLAILLLVLGHESSAKRAIPVAASVVLLLFVVPTLHRHVFTAPREDPWGLRERELVAAGLKAGARLAVANPSAAPYEYRRAGLSIHADIRSTPEVYCSLSEDRRVSLEGRLRMLGLDAIVLEGSTPAACTGFRRSGHYLVKALGPA